jgi:uncharacterized protein (TIGR03089 family)
MRTGYGPFATRIESPPVTELIAERLRRRIRTSGAGPLITYYDLGSAERTELSAVTFGTWVDKTSNLLVDELSVQPGHRIGLELARTHPGHWVTSIWELAIWQVGAVATPDPGSGATVVVTGPTFLGTAGVADAPHADSDSPDLQLVVCSLHPLGLGLPQPPGAGVVDYSTEVRQQPDRYFGAPVDHNTLAWDEPSRQFTQADLVSRPAQPPRRRLLQPADSWSAARALVDAIRSDGSLVVVVGSTDPNRLAHIAVAERAVN